MVDISLMIEGQMGLTWTHWKKLVREAEELGFAGLFRSDHFTGPQPPEQDSLEMIVSLTYLADHSQRLHFGPLVAPISFRNPMLLVRQAAALDDLSDGRMLLGLGAGWQEREHDMFGFELGSIPTRMARLEEALEVISRLLNSEEPVTFKGHFFQLKDAKLLPRPRHPGGPRILIGGNGKQRTLPLAARYATVWNATYLAPDAFKERSAHLDTLLEAAGRQPSDVKRTMMISLLFGEDEATLDRRLAWRHGRPEMKDLPLAQVVERVARGGRALVGNAEQIRAQIQTYAEAGVEELMLQWFDIDDLDGLRTFATSVLPHI